MSPEWNSRLIEKMLRAERANHYTSFVNRPKCETFLNLFSEVSLRLSLE